MAEKLKHNLHIATYIRKAIKAGVSMKVILNNIQKYDNAPSSMNAMSQDLHEKILHQPVLIFKKQLVLLLLLKPLMAT